MADDAVKQGKVSIQDAQDYFKWASTTQSSIMYIFVFKSESLPGTMKLHAIGYDHTRECLRTRTTSCYCQICLESFCDSWNKVAADSGREMKQDPRLDEVPAQMHPTGTVFENESTDIPLVAENSAVKVAKIELGKYYIVKYSVAGKDVLYIGKCIEDDDPESPRFLFMRKSEKVKNKFVRPVVPDESDVDGEEVIRRLNDPVLCRRGGCLFNDIDVGLKLA